jgi:hypothetical protein
MAVSHIPFYRQSLMWVAYPTVDGIKEIAHRELEHTVYIHKLVTNRFWIIGTNKALTTYNKACEHLIKQH